MDEKAYDIVYRERLDRIEKKLDEAITLIRGHNATPGLLEEVRVLKAANRKAFAAVIFVAAAVAVQAVRTTWDWLAGVF
jgi:hypothetical protein